MELSFDEMLAEQTVREEHERRVKQALDEAKGLWEQETQARLAAARAEGERIAGMSAEEKLREREAQIAQRERELVRRELVALAAELLAAKGLPGELAEVLRLEDADGCQRSVECVERAFRSAVQDGVTRRLGAETPPMGGMAVDPAALTDAQYYTGLLKTR